MLLSLPLAFGIYAGIRYTLNLPASKRGYDAINYVILHGNVQHDRPAAPIHPTDVTGVYINEGYANRTMVELLHYLSNLRSVTIGPDLFRVPAGTPANQLPNASDLAKADAERIREAFPDLDVQIAQFSDP